LLEFPIEFTTRNGKPYVAINCSLLTFQDGEQLSFAAENNELRLEDILSSLNSSIWGRQHQINTRTHHQ